MRSMDFFWPACQDWLKGLCTNWKQTKKHEWQLTAKKQGPRLCPASIKSHLVFEMYRWAHTHLCTASTHTLPTTGSLGTNNVRKQPVSSSWIRPSTASSESGRDTGVPSSIIGLCSTTCLDKRENRRGNDAGQCWSWNICLSYDL